MDDRATAWPHAAGALGSTALKRSHLMNLEDATAIPERLHGCQLGEESARRNRDLLKKSGTVVVLRQGVPWKTWQLTFPRFFKQPPTGCWHLQCCIRSDTYLQCLLQLGLSSSSPKVAYSDLHEQGQFAPLCSFVSHYWGQDDCCFCHTFSGTQHVRVFLSGDSGGQASSASTCTESLSSESRTGTGDSFKAEQVHDRLSRSFWTHATTSTCHP